MAIKRVFWNFKSAFIGSKMVPLAVKNFLIYPVSVFIPLYAFSTV